MSDQPNGHEATALPDADPAEVIRLTEQQRQALAPYRAAVAQAQEALSAAFGLLVTGAGVDLSKNAARLDDDGRGYVVRPLAAAGDG